MDKHSKMRRKAIIWIGIMLLLSLGLVLAACSQPSPGGTTAPESSGGTTAPDTATPIPNENGVITADQWKDIYPDIYASYQMNMNNKDQPSYLEQYPYMVTIYDGSGFAKDYNEARGHLYSLDDVDATARPHAFANCITCKTPELSALVNRDGIGIYSQEFPDVRALITEPISCYNCHENTGDQTMVPAPYLNDALGADKSKVDAKILACGQCHNEYYFDPDTKAVTLPWNGIDKMNPEAMLAYYNEIPFTDFTNTISGADMVKVQHPEMETVLGEGNKLEKMGNESCADCHMGTATNEEGEEFISHYWQSPLMNSTLIENRCSKCHLDLAADVKAIKTDTHDRLVTIGNKLADLHVKIGEAAENGSKTEDELAELRQLVRDAQWYFDFVQVENSYGAHNSTLTKQLLDKSEEMVDGALTGL